MLSLPTTNAERKALPVTFFTDLVALYRPAPIPMVNPGAFQGSRKQFLLAEKAGYADALKTGTANDFLTDLTRRYFKRYPADLDHDVEPSAEHLDAVRDDAPDPEIPEPDPALPADELAVAQAKYAELQKTIVFRVKVRFAPVWFSWTHTSFQLSTSKSAGGCRTNTIRIAKSRLATGSCPQPMLSSFIS